MAQKITTDEARMRQVVGELDQVYSSMSTNVKKMSDLVGSVKSVWTDDNVNAYIKSYQKREPQLQAIAEAIRNASATLGEITQGYSKADSSALDAIKSGMGGKR